jgi:hypothetical protein
VTPAEELVGLAEAFLAVDFFFGGMLVKGEMLIVD